MGEGAGACKCRACGRFFRITSEAEWMMFYSGFPLLPNKVIYRCGPCVKKFGGFSPQLGIIPSFSCGKMIAAPSYPLDGESNDW